MCLRRRITLLVVTALALSLVSVSAASAAGGLERQQNKRIAQTRERTNALEMGINDLSGRLKVIETAAPAIIQGLTDLKNGLTKLGDAYQAVEYGRAGLFYTNGTAVAGTSVTSADIPDDGNAITVVEDAIVAIPATAATTINLRAAIRSNEEDGDSTSETAGQAGGFIQVYRGNNGDSVPCAGSTAPLGIFGTQPGDSIVTPSGTVTTLPLKNIPGGVLRTDTTKPDGTSTSLLPAACTISGATIGDVYKVHYSVNFLDIPTSTSPGPKE